MTLGVKTALNLVSHFSFNLSLFELKSSLILPGVMSSLKAEDKSEQIATLYEKLKFIFDRETMISSNTRLTSNFELL